MECIPSILYCGARSLYSCTANFEPRAQGGFTPQAPLCKKKPKGGGGGLVNKYGGLVEKFSSFVKKLKGRC